MKKQHILSLLVLLFLSAAAMAQVPQAMTYQSVLRDANGNLVANRNIAVRISIHQGTPNGTSVYVETHRTTTNANGLYTLRIGTGNAEQGIFANIDWGNGPFFSVSETDPDGGTNYRITTTQQLLSVPYALYAEYAAHCPTSGGGAGTGSRDTIVINNISRDTLYVFDTIVIAADTVYQITSQRDTLYQITNHYDTIVQRDTLYNVTNHYDTLYQVTNHYDTIVQRDTLYNITNHYDTLIQRDTLYQITNHYDTLVQRDTLFQITNHYDTLAQRDTLYQITNHYDTLVQRDTLYQITNHYDTLVQRDTLYQITNHYDTLVQRDTLYQITNHYDTLVQRDTLYQITNHYDTLVQRDTLYSITNHYDTLVQRDTLYQITNHYDTLVQRDTLYQITNHYDTLAQRDTLVVINNDTVFSFDTIYHETTNSDTIYQFDTIYHETASRDTIVVINNDTLFSFDTIYQITTNSDTIYQFDTIYHETTNRDTIVVINNDTIYQYDTLYQITTNSDTIYQFDTIYHETTSRDTIVVINNDTMFSFDTIYQTTTNSDTIYQFDTIYHETTSRDTIVVINNDTVFSFDTIYHETTNRDTIVVINNDTVFSFDTIYQLTTQKDTIYSFDTIFSNDTITQITTQKDTLYSFDTIYQLTTQKDTIYSFDTIFSNDTITQIITQKDTLYSFDTIYQLTTQKDTIYSFDTIFSNDTITQIITQKDTLYSLDTIYQLTTNKDTIYSFDTIFSNDTITQIITQKDTLYSFDTIYQLTTNKDTIYSFDTIFSNDTITQLITQKDTIYSFDTIYHETTNRDTIYSFDTIFSNDTITQIITQKDTLYSFDTIYHETTTRDTIYQYDTIYQITTNSDTIYQYDTIYQVTTQRDTIYSQCDYGCLDSVRHVYDSIINVLTYVIDSIRNATPTDPPTSNMEGCECTGTVAVNGVLPGVFSVSSTKQVRFSQGNLQYTTVGTHQCADGTTKQGTWRFADCQCQYVGDANSNASATYTGYIDLFGWGTSGYHNDVDVYNSNYYPYSTSTSTINATYNHYGYGPSSNQPSPNLTSDSRYYDWGIYNAISNGGNLPELWRTLTNDEWNYIINIRNSSIINNVSNARYCKAVVCGVNGLILFPDNYSHPSSITLPNNINVSGSNYNTNNYNVTQWQSMEAVGAIFLPAAGLRMDAAISLTGSETRYWSSTYKSQIHSYFLLFNANSVVPQYYSERSYGRSVRLVRDIADPCIGHTSTGIDEQTAEGSFTWIDGNTYTASTTTPTYTITGGNAAGCDSIVTLHLTITQSIPDMEGCECTGTVAVNGVLPGVFSVSSTKQVRFSQGNLQYTTVGTHQCADGTTKQGTWRFADCQCQYVGDANSNISATYTGYIDLFGWGTSGYHNSNDSYNTNYYPYSTSKSEVNTTNNSYGYGPSSNMPSPDLTGSSRYYDWGVYNAIANGGNTPDMWRTLTKDEWGYIINTRDCSTVGGTANARFCKASVNGVNGVVLFPDSYTHPATAPTPGNINRTTAVYTANAFTATAWQSMEANGAAFLPASGLRIGTNISNAGSYWSASYYNSNNAYSLYFYSTYMDPQNRSYHYHGRSVRLVQDYVDPCLGNTSSTTDDQTVCDSYTWTNGQTYTENNTSAQQTLQNQAGCDSTVTLHLTIRHSSTSIDEQNVCGSLLWIDGNTYNETTNTPTYTYVGGNAAGCDSTVTLNLTVTMEGYTYTTTIDNEGALPGVFSVSSTQKVKFSKGNLQYSTMGSHQCADGTTMEGTWRFAECQTQYVGQCNSYISNTYKGWIDHFGWGTSGWNSGANAHQPYCTSTSQTDYYPGGSYTNNLTGTYRYADWGVYNAIANGGNTPDTWRTLTKDEWGYLFNTRGGSTVGGTANARFCKASVNGVNGVVLFPDSYSHPANAPSPVSINTTWANFTTNTFTATEWQSMEANGAVFLPASGGRRGTEALTIGTYGSYWTTSYDNNIHAYCLTFYPSGLGHLYGYYRYDGESVRLVQDVE